MTTSNEDKIVTVFGGSGFLGRNVVRALAKKGYRIRVAIRRPELASHLQPLGGVGQIQLVQTNLRYSWSVARAVEGAHAVVNCVGLLFETGKQSFESIHVSGAAFIAQAATDAGVKKLVHVSAIGASDDSNSDYARTKFRGEEAIKSQFPDVTIMRPSVIFGAEDGFFNKFAAMSRIAPFLPLIGGGETLFQPVYVGDVSEAIVAAVDGTAESGCTYELGGPDTETFAGLMADMLVLICRKTRLIKMPWSVASFMGTIAGWLPKPVFTADQVELLKSDNIVSKPAIDAGLTLEGLSIKPRAMASILPGYLWTYREHGQFTSNREKSSQG